ncbi:TPA-induced transmembrane protein [Erinaceus europaeus]|uniref:TPA-induced transmembrane protein n=1 Tax=Erinaceus europaeus TaxID=9365 RepID=A0A1S3W2W5_ERIEU|nr:TPA-induced transmembrane protein [Erinaceus europaeus]
MEEASSQPPGDDLELSALRDERRPLNGAVLVIPSSAEEPCSDQVKKESPWSSCNKTLFGKCKLWMAILSVFLGFIILIIISLVLIRVTYIDEDENEIPELSSNKTFFITLKIPEECATEEELPVLLTKRFTDVYSSSPSLSPYFTSVEINNYSVENATITYHLQFGVPSEDDAFMKHMMSEEFVLAVLLQNFHDESIPGCETLGLDPLSVWLDE